MPRRSEKPISKIILVALKKVGTPMAKKEILAIVQDHTERCTMAMMEARLTVLVEMGFLKRRQGGRTSCATYQARRDFVVVRAKHRQKACMMFPAAEIICDQNRLKGLKGPASVRTWAPQEEIPPRIHPHVRLNLSTNQEITIVL